MRYKSKRSKACDIPERVKLRVMARDDGRCIICGLSGFPNAHYIPRSQGGLGIEQNVVTLCPVCHQRYDNGDKREEYGAYIKQYLSWAYENWNEKDLIYNKWRDLDERS